MQFRRVSLLAVMLLSAVRAAVIYDESVSGDLSNSGLSPSVLSVALGSNQIFGTTGRTTAVDRDYFSITIPGGLQLSSLTLLPGTVSNGALGFSFIGIQTGSQVTIPTNAATANGLLGWWHYAATDVGTNILPEIGVPANGSTGFTGALSSGTYSFWVQDFDPGPLPYRFDLQLTQVPEPGTGAMLVAGLAAAALTTRRIRTSVRTKQPTS